MDESDLYERIQSEDTESFQDYIQRLGWTMVDQVDACPGLEKGVLKPGYTIVDWPYERFGFWHTHMLV